MLNICMILPKGLPMPNVKGGAIETLMTDIIRENEKEKKINLTVFSVYDDRAILESKKYKMTNFNYIKMDTRYKIEGLIVRFKNLFGNNLNTYNEMVLRRIKKKKFDYILVEDGAYFSFESYLKYFDRDQMILHFHHCGESDLRTDNTFSTVLGVSDFVTRKFINSSNIKNCITLKNGIDLSKFNLSLSKIDKQKLKKELGINDDDFVVLFCGRLVKEKGVLELVRALKQIKSKNIKLVIVGSINFGNQQTSEYLNYLMEEIETSNNRIVSTGYIKYDQLYKYYKLSDVVAIPSLCEDAALLVNIEAMACGIPTIITRTGGAVEYASKETIIIEKKNVVDNLKREILNLYSDKSKRVKMTEEGLKTSKLYSTQKFYNDFINTLDNLDEKNKLNRLGD